MDKYDIILLKGVIRLSEIIGQKFGLLTAVEIVGKSRRGPLVKCVCECGGTKTVAQKELRSGNNKSCGCLHKKHGLTGSRIYQAWGNMKKRCNDPTNKSYVNYGGRGISYDKRWESFENFYEDMKDGYADDLTLDRIDVNKDYSKDNCRWVDMKTQGNNKTDNHLVTYNGETLTLSEMARKHGITVDLFKSRLYKGWSVKDALETPVYREEITYNGITKTVAEWAKEYGMTYHQLKKRLMRGWSVERAITQPLRKRSK